MSEATKRMTRKELRAPDEFVTVTGQVVEWARKNTQLVALGTGAVLAALLVYAGVRWFIHGRDERASREFYAADELARIVRRSAGLLDVPVDDAGALEIARRSRGTPRISNRLLRRVRDYVDVKAEGRIDAATADRALVMLDVDPLGLDVMDRKLLEAVIHRFDGGPVGLDNVAAAIGEEPGTIEDVIEPYLIQQGYLQRTPRGRVATVAAWRHLGLVPPAGLVGRPNSDDLFGA